MAIIITTKFYGSIRSIISNLVAGQILMGWSPYFNLNGLNSILKSKVKQMTNNLLRQLQETVEISSELAIHEQVRNIGEAKVVEAVPYLIALLQKTNDCGLRNLLALALADIGDQRALEPLIALIKSKTTVGCRGTLVYALQSLDCVSILVDLVEMAINGGLEVSCEAVNAIESIKSPYLSKEVQLGCQKIEMALQSESSLEPDKIERLKWLKHLLETRVATVEEGNPVG